MKLGLFVNKQDKVCSKFCIVCILGFILIMAGITLFLRFGNRFNLNQGFGEDQVRNQKDEAEDFETAEFFAMDTYFTLKVYGAGADRAIGDCKAKVEELEGLLSVTKEDSDIWRINHDKNAIINKETYDLISDAVSYGEWTDGALDITIYPVLREWGFTTGEYRIPEANRLRELLEYVDYRNVGTRVQTSTWTDKQTDAQVNMQKNTEENTQVDVQSQTVQSDPETKIDGESEVLYTVTVPDQVEIDLGAVAKGYTGDSLIRILRQQGVTSAILDLGGNVQTLGAKPDGSPWRIGVRDPYDSDAQLGTLEISDKCVITSGSYERFFIGKDGKRYWHILDPTDGCPADKGLVSVTVVGDKGEECDALSTALFVMGKEKAVEFWRQQGGFDMILMTEQGQLYMTEGLEDCFSCADNRTVTLIFSKE